MNKFKIGDCVQTTEELGDKIHDAVVIPKGAVGVVGERSISDDGGITYTIDFSSGIRSFSVIVRGVPESTLQLFSRI